MRRSAFLWAFAALVGAAGVSAAQQSAEEPAATRQTPIVVPADQQAPATDGVLADPQSPAAEEAPPGQQAPPTEQVSTDQQAPTGEPVAINPNPLSSLTLDSLTTTRTAPLFTASRTAPAVAAPVEEVTAAAPVAAAPPTEEPPPQLELIGIVLTDTKQTALLRDPSTNEVHRLSSGEQFNNWVLKIVDARSVEFHQGDRVQELKMFAVFPVSAVSGDEGVPGFDGEMEPRRAMRPQLGNGGQDPDQSVGGAENPDNPQSSDIVQGAEDAQSTDIVRVPNEAENLDNNANPEAGQNQSGDPDAPPPQPPPADFAPPVGNTPIPDEDAFPPDPNSN